MRSFFLIVIAASLLSAQPVINNLRAVSSHGSVLVRAEITNSAGQSQLRLETGVTAALGSVNPNVASSSTASLRSLYEGGLLPSTVYYFRISVTASTGTTLWSCAPGSAGPGWICDDASGLGMFMTSALPENHGEPHLPATIDTRMPEVTGQTFQVASDCANFQEVVNSCGAADPSLVHQIRVPQGAVCRGTFDLPDKSGAGVCIIRSAAPDKELPPEAVRVDSSYRAKMPRFVLPQSAIGELPGPRAIINSTATEGWRFLGLNFELDTPLVHRKVPISNVSADGTITTAVPHGLQYYQQVYIVGVRGFNGRGPNGSWAIVRSGASTFKLRLAAYNVMGIPDFTCPQAPCYVPGTGYLIQTVGTSIASATSTTPPVVTTQLEHGLFNEPWWNIISAAGSSLTLQNGHTIDSRARAVEIEGSSLSVMNGVWISSTVSGTTLTLKNGPSGTCSANCGRIRLKRAVHIRGAKGATSLNGNHLYTVLDDFRVQIDDAVGGVYQGSGVLSFDPDYYFGMLRFGAASKRIILDRCIISGAEWPNRLYKGLSLLSADSAFIDSRIENVKNWRSINPRTNEAESSHDDMFTATSIAVEITTGDRKKVHNNYINSNGISVFAQEFTNNDLVEDVTFTRNVLYSSPEDLAGGANSIGLYYPKRQHFELKQGKRFLIEGNVFDGGWSDWTPCGAHMIFTPRGATVTSHQIADLTIRNNTFRNGASGIQLMGSDTVYETDLAFLMQRVKIEGNLLYDIDLRKWASTPSAVASGVCGYAIQALRAVEDVSILWNTAFDVRGKQTQFFAYGLGRSEGVIVRNNIFSHNHDNSTGALTPSGQLTGFTPAITGNVGLAWSQYFRTGSNLSNNVVIPGVKNTTTTAIYDSPVTYLQTYTKSECESYYSAFTGITCIGAGVANETANQRIAAMKFFSSDRRDFRLRFDSPGKAGLQSRGLDMGADIDQLETAQGKLRNVRIRSGATSTTVNYVTPDADACFIDYGTDPSWTSHTRLSDGGGSKVRSIELNGLTVGTLYYYRLSCASEQPRGSFVTAR